MLKKKAENYSALGLLKHALTGHKHWPKVWRSPEPKSQYDVVVIGGGIAFYVLSQDGGGAGDAEEADDDDEEGDKEDEE